ncbi:MAG: hypothetical protein NC548_41515 [Lachnospiraceae bacterium]|nr:hypothetical protein [Lachnospiraceae bacterium]
MNHLFIKGLSISSLAAMLLLSCVTAGSHKVEKNDQHQILTHNATMNNQCLEKKKEIVPIRKQDNADVMEEDEIFDYVHNTSLWGNMGEKRSFKILILDALEEYFPNLQNEVWVVKEKRGNHYIAEFYGNIIDMPREECAAYTGEFILQPNFTITVLEDTIALHPENGFCAYTSGEIYAYRGCYIEECTGSYLDSQRNNRLDVSFPIYYTKDAAWREFNDNIWTGLENWFLQKTENERNVSIAMDYEIKSCSDGLFSILFKGQMDEGGAKEDIAMALTVSVSGEKLVPLSMFVRGEEEGRLYDYYVEDGILYLIDSGSGKWESVENGKVEMCHCDVDRIERHVYNSNGCWLGNCYYEVPVLGYASERTQISRYIREDLGKFLNETAVVFEETVHTLPGVDIVYASEDDSATMLNGPGGYHCYVDAGITYNNNGILEITYSYNVLENMGEAVAVYDLNAGTVLEHQEWQNDMIRLLQEKMREHGRYD